MKKYLGKIYQVTIASLISMILYVLTSWLTSAFMNETPKPLYTLALVIYSVVMMSAFTLIYLYRTYIQNSVGEKNAMQDFKNGYWGFKKDILFLIQHEVPTLITFALINGLSWLLISIDILLFSKRTVTAILLLYAPLNIIGVTLPTWGNSLLGYLSGTVLCFALYLLELVVFRKKWYIHWNKPKS